MLAGVLVFAGSRQLPSWYFASATLFLPQRSFTGIPLNQALSIEACAQLATLEIVQNRVVAQLLASGRITDARQVIFEDSRALGGRGGSGMLPLLTLHTLARTPEAARDAANVWAEVLVDEQATVLRTSGSLSADFVVSEFSLAQKALREREEDLGQFDDRRNRAVRDFDLRAPLESDRARLASREALLVEIEAKHARAIHDLAIAQAVVAAIDDELRNVAESLVTDRQISTAGVTAPGRLRTSSPNPVRGELEERLSHARLQAATLAAAVTDIGAQERRLRTDIAALRARIGNLELERSEIVRRFEMERADRARFVNEQTARFKRLQAWIGDAQLLRAERPVTLQISAPAILPDRDRPVSPRPIEYALVTALGMLGLLVLITVGADPKTVVK